jgi:hypothetical protein
MMVNETKNGCSNYCAGAMYGATIDLDRFGFKRFLKLRAGTAMIDCRMHGAI